MQRYERKGVAGGATGEVVENKGARMTERVGLTRQVMMASESHTQDYHGHIGLVQ
jgi:hypothetical protein